MASVLVVDDEVGMREFYNRALAAAGFHAIDVRTAEEALDRLALSSDIGVVIADLNMPGNGGLWLVNQARTKYPRVAVILATASEVLPGSVSLQSTVTSYLVKPISVAQLLHAVEEAFTWHERSDGTPSAADKDIDAFLDRKLTHRSGSGDGGAL